MNENEFLEETTETPTETETEETTETETETPTEETTQEVPLSSDPVDVSEGFYNMEDNVIHDLFYTLGVNLDYVPKNPYQCFTLALQFCAALWFIWHFVKFLWRLMIQTFSVGR